MIDIAVIILMKDEILHIKRCLERLASLNPRQIFIVDCFSTDGSVETVNAIRQSNNLKLNNIELVQRKWPGTQAKQFGWALENLPIDAGWILRLDADEYLLPELVAEIKEKLPQMLQTVDGVVLKRRHIFSGKWVRHGTYPTRILRLFRTGRGLCDGKLMDEHIVVQGQTVEFDCDFVDHSLISFEDWKEKHRGYAKREAQSYLGGEVSEGAKASAKAAYYKLPRYFRAVAYFCIRYFLKGGFLDGRAGWRWNFWQGLWYRWIVDREIGRMRRAGGEGNGEPRKTNTGDYVV